MSFETRLKSEYDTRLARSSGEEKRFRETAWAAFQSCGLPDRKTETWKYSNVSGLVKRDWRAGGAGAPLDGWNKDFEVIEVNGAGQVDWNLPLEIEDGWIAASAAVAAPGIELHIRKTPPKPVLLVHRAGAWTSRVHRVCVDLAEIFLGEGEYMRSDITVAHLGAGATVRWVRAQQEAPQAFHFSEVQTHLASGAVLHLSQVNSGAQWSRSSLRADIHGTGAEAHISGLNFGHHQQHLDQRIEIRHRAPSTQSSQLFKGVLKDRARGIVNGKIYIAPHAQKVNSHQLNHNLLLSPTAEADTKPELEIYADDVKANHGASVGRMDEDRLFYLMSRGVARVEAERMLARAFVADVLMKAPKGVLRDFLSARVEDLLPEFLAEAP